MKNPNGYGTIKFMGSHRRRPFAFLITENGKQKYIQTFETIVEAKIFQADYYLKHKHKHLPGRKMSFAEVYHRWLSAHLDDNPDISDSTLCSYKNAYRHCSPLHLRPFADLKYTDFQRIIDDMRHKEKLSYSSCKKVRNLISLMSQYAQKTELCKTNYAPLVSIGKNHATHPHRVISRQKINKLWAVCDSCPGTDTVLILLYTGMRVGELLALEKKNVNLRQRFLRIVKSKTVAGLRNIPIHTRIMPLVQTRMSAPDSLFLIADEDGLPYSYSRYRSEVWDKVLAHINGSQHTPHDTRHTVTTLLDNAGANENAKRRILGHTGGDVTDRVYTHKNLHQLRKCIQLLK